MGRRTAPSESTSKVGRGPFRLSRLRLHQNHRPNARRNSTALPPTMAPTRTPTDTPLPSDLLTGLVGVGFADVCVVVALSTSRSKRSSEIRDPAPGMDGSGTFHNVMVWIPAVSKRSECNRIGCGLTGSTFPVNSPVLISVPSVFGLQSTHILFVPGFLSCRRRP